ncbi:PP2C family serine/threonine-protein phosphatase [Pseudomonas sp. NMI4491_12]|uniref:PP2C family serine/threonine-protein phosphatase n=1 Tax=Pseudomonas sp. NMI4491_12 TaxID=2903146 RepID=UPI001E36AB06|nr:PP2C family serine/threonine-protein phosphatase [Pseudomonas sp. NMI4491_12]MCE0966723.1 protein phosphatase 2C domain-containing protein [Pseudomonas sp. NMI4491_12]
MRETVADFRYKTSCGRITGRSHAHSKTPCQDYAAVRHTSDLACIALADGAGSREKSEFGSEAAVKATIRFVCSNFEELWSQAEADSVTVSHKLLSYCLEALQRKAKRLKCEVGELACTLMFVVHSKGRFLAGHLGDGFIARLGDDGEVIALSHPDNGEFANTTVFVTDTTAHRRFRLIRGEGDCEPGFVIMSDGTAESLYLRATRTPAASAIKSLLRWNSSLSKLKMKKVLNSNLEQVFSKKSADDCSIAILSIKS